MFVHNFIFLTCFCGNSWAFALSSKKAFLNFSVCYNFTMKRLYPEEQKTVVDREKQLNLSCLVTECKVGNFGGGTKIQ